LQHLAWLSWRLIRNFPALVRRLCSRGAPGPEKLQRRIDLGEERLDFGALVRAGSGFKPRQQLLFLSQQLRKSGHPITAMSTVSKGPLGEQPFLGHQLRVPKLKPMLGPPP
jgi:hypothetical protein